VEAAALLRRAGLPDGVLQVLAGGAGVAQELCADSRVAGVHFTGSTRAGRAINELVAPRFARAALEMGGVNAAIVFPDADVAAAAAAVVASGTALAGQKCTAVRRVLVHRDVADRFTDELRSRMEALVVGVPGADDADVGPMVTASARQTAEDAVSAALGRGGRVIARSQLTDGIVAGERSAYFAPVVLTGLAADDPLTTEELFAPVLLLDVFADEDDVWALANASGYGLAGAVYTRDPRRAAEARRRLSVGVLAINGRSDAVGLEQPFGGRGLSGNGLPEGGRYVYSAVTDTLAVYDDSLSGAGTDVEDSLGY
jgi:benzaldehyde dehydrogenase (NAD)